MDLDVELGDRLTREANCKAEGLDHVNNREEVFACHTQGYILGLHGRQGYFGLKAGFPEHRTPKGENNKTSLASGTMWILGVLVAIETGEVSIRKAVNTGLVRRREDKTLVHGTFEVTADSDESELVLPSGSKSIAGTLVDRKGDVRAAMTTEVEEHSHNRGIIEGTRGEVSL